jgi:hypothetical protein
MGNRIDTVTARNKLKPRRELYWHRISKGFFVGYRKMSEGSDGVWLFRQYSSDSRDPQRTLGSLTRFPNHERFDQAVAQARQLVADDEDTLHLAAARSVTVWDECIAYVEHIRASYWAGQGGTRPQDQTAALLPELARTASQQ